jgi:hypothetical protein
MNVVVGQISNVTELVNLKDKAKDKPHLGFTRSGQIYVLENGSHRVLQPQEAIEKTGIDPELLKKLIANGGVVEEEQQEEAVQEPESTPEEVVEETVQEPETAPDEEVVEETELNISKKVLKRISKLEYLLERAVEELANLKNDIM